MLDRIGDMKNQARPLRVSVDQVIALCDEMRALARSGVPLERGMLTMASELPGQLGRIAAEIGERGESGQSLEQILNSDRLKLPDVLRAMIVAGVRSGRLSVALEGMATSARRIAELRRSIIQATVYPLLVLIIVCGLCFFVLTRLSVAYADALNHHRARSMTWGIAAMEFIGNWMWILGPVAVLAFLVWLFCTGQASALQPRQLTRWMIWLPWTRRLLRHARLSTFLDVLALLLEQGVPLHEALSLSGQASGDESLRKDANDLAAAMEKGESAQPIDKSENAIPPLVRWQLASQSSQPELISSLKATAQSERRRADYLADWLRIQLPVILTFGVGGVATFIYAMAVMAPWYSMLGRFADPTFTMQ